MTNVSKVGFEDMFAARAELQQALLKHYAGSQTTTSALQIANMQGEQVKAIVSPNELNHCHGTGVLIPRIFKNDADILSIRSSSHYSGAQTFGKYKYQISYAGLSRYQSFLELIKKIGHFDITEIILVPYYRDDYMTALILKELYDVPLLVYVMDDTNIVWNHVEDKIVGEVLRKADIRFAISRQMVDAYEQKWQLKFWLAPPVVPAHLLAREIVPSNDETMDRGVIIGNFWSPEWMTLLRKVLKESGNKVDWFGGLANSLSSEDIQELAFDGIVYRGFVATEDELSTTLRKYRFSIVPSGHLGDEAAFKAVAQLSLPSRIPFLLATANLPVLVLGDETTAAAKFVEELDIGLTVNYSNLAEGIKAVCAEDNQTRFRQNAARHASIFSDEGFGDWLKDSWKTRQPKDFRFEKLLPKPADCLTRFINSDAPDDLYGDFKDVYLLFWRFKYMGYSPDFVVDVGASVGIWSNAVSRIYKDVRFVLVEPLFSHYPQSSRDYFAGSIENKEIVEAALSDHIGSAKLRVSHDLYGSSLLHPEDFRTYEEQTVPVTTLDTLGIDCNITGRGVLKIDTQYAEHIVLRGGVEFLKKVDVLLVEMSLVRYSAEAKIFHELLAEIYAAGFEYFDAVGGWRAPVTGKLLEVDAVFIRPGVV